MGTSKTLQSQALVAEDSLGMLRQRGSVLGAALYKVKRAAEHSMLG